MTAKTNTSSQSIPVTSSISSIFKLLPDLSGYSNRASVRTDFLRGVKSGRLAAARAAKRSRWDFDDETDALDLAIESVALGESMSFAFLEGFAAGFRHAFQMRFLAA